MEQRVEMVVCGLVAACGLLGAASVGGSQTPESGRAPLRDVSVPSAAFGDDTGEVHCRVSKGAYAYYRPDAGAFDADCDLVAAIQLPDRARLASLTCSLYDAEPANAMEAHLVRVDLATGDLSSVFLTPGTADNGAIQVLSDVTAAPGTALVDNARYAYYVAAAFSYTNFTETGNGMRVYGCRVSFR